MTPCPPTPASAPWSADNGFSCSHSNGVVECFGGSILGTAAEFYPPFGAPGNDTATIVIRVFAQPNVGTGVNGMHNEARVDPLNEIAEINENNNIDFEDTDVVSGNGDQGAFNQLTIVKTQVSPANPVARNGVVTYNLAIGNAGTDPALGSPCATSCPRARATSAPPARPSSAPSWRRSSSAWAGRSRPGPPRTSS